MNKSSNITKAVAIAVILMMTFSAAFMALPLTNGSLERQIAPFLSIAPNPVGVGQTITISAWTQPLPPTANDRFDNISVTMTKPGGTQQTFGPVRGGPLGNWVWQYTPDVAGTYLFQMHIPDQPFPNAAGGDITYKGADGPVVNVTVQQDAVLGMPQVPLPTEYWTYPINAQNQLWAAISGSWLRSNYDGINNGYNPYMTDTSGHILWRWRNAFGGLEGGPYGAVAYSQGKQYEGKMTPGILINNYFYQYGPIGDRVNSPLNQLNCIDINTGQVVWTKAINSSGVSVGSVPLQGQLYQFDSSNQVGIHAYIWYMGSTKWSMYDAFNGNWIMDFVNVTTSSANGDDSFIAMEPNGNMMQYTLNTGKGWLAGWNFTKACIGKGINDGVITWQSQEEKNQYGVAGGQWRPSSTALNDWSRGIEFNVSVPVENQYMGPRKTASLSWGGVSKAGGIAVAESWWNDPVLVSQNIIELYGYSLDNSNPSNPPHKIWGPVNLTTTANTARAIDAETNTYVLNSKERMTYVGYDLTTGQQKWETPPMTYPWGAYGAQSMTVAKGKMYAGSYDGLHCYDLKDGKELWFFSAGDSGVDTPYGTWIGNGQMVGGDIVYYRTGQFHPTSVMLRGDRLYAVNATTGKNIWNMTFWVDGTLCGNGVVIANNIYDNEIYAFGKGPSATTVSAQQSVTGANVLIQGTVTDQSPGLTKGTAAISDAYMGQWMDYMYMQQPKPANAYGVPVSIDAYDPNGNLVHLGDTTSDTTGTYAISVPASTLSAGAGQYRIIATFSGSGSYYKSSAETALQMDAAATTAPTSPNSPVSQAPLDMYILGATVAIIIAIAIVGLLVVRKRP